MAKKPIQLSKMDIILQADAETIREALEARVQIDELLVQREAAYRQINELEEQIETIVGEDGLFAYPAAPLPVAGIPKLIDARRPKSVKPETTDVTEESVVKEAPEPDAKEED